MRSAVKDVSHLLSGSVIAKLFGLVALMFFARALTKEEMAVFPAFLMLAGFANLILTFGIFSTFMRDLPLLLRNAEMPRIRSLVVTGSLVIVAGTIPPAIATFFWSEAISFFVYKNAENAWIIKIMVPGFLAFVLAKIVEYVMWGAGRFAETAKVQILESIIRPLLTVLLFVLMGFKGVVIGLVLAQAVIAVIGFFYVRDMFFGTMEGLYPLQRLLKESGPYYIGNYLSYLRGDGDTILVSAFLGPAPLAAYYVAKTLYSNLMLVLSSVDKVAVERLARFAGTAEFSNRIARLHDEIAETTIPFVLLTIALTPFAMTVLAGHKYADTTWPAVALLISALVQFIAIPVERAIFVALPGLVRVSYAGFEVLLVVGVAFLLMPVAGLTGIAAARIVSPAAGFLIGLYILRKRIDITLSHKTIWVAFFTALPGTVLILVLSPPLQKIPEVIAAAMVAGTAWCTIFVLFSYLFNRQLLERGVVFVRGIHKKPFGT